MTYTSGIHVNQQKTELRGGDVFNNMLQP